MLTCRRTALATLVLLFAVTACSEAPTQVTDAAVPDASENANAATTERQTFTVPFPPPPAEFVPVPAPCLGLGEPLQMSGTWTGWFQTTETEDGRVHITEHIDYSQIVIELDDLTWLPGPGAFETIIFNIKHEFHARFLSQDGLPDLRVSHRIKQLVDANGVLRQNEFVPFAAECIGKRG